MAAGCWGGNFSGVAGGLAAYGVGVGVGCCRSGFSRYSSATFVAFQQPAHFKFVMEIPASANEVAPDLRAK
eukprot:13323443-Ditylum_brightwellii.AAC.1